MTTEIATYQDPGAVVVQQQASMQTQAVQRLAEWAASAQAAYTVAEKLCETSFCPQGYRGKPAEATAAMLAGAEVGLSPLASLRSFDPIQGVSAPRAITLRAIVQSQGHQIMTVESTATRCKMKGRRRGESEWQQVTWTMDRAKDLGLTGKPNWKSQPQNMLVARATSEICRLIAADAILGIAFTFEEIRDGVDPEAIAASEDGATPGEEQPKTRRMSRKRPTPQTDDGAGSQAETSGVEGEGGSIPSDTTAPSSLALITDAQSKKLHATFNDLGITERDARMAYTIDVIGRDIESSKDLTKDEASQVIDRLQHDLEQPFPGAE